MSSLLEINNLQASVGDKPILKGLSLSIQPGEVHAIMGPNGSGKSTTAKLALGIMTPSEGSVYRRENARVSYVPQRLSIDWTMPLRVNRFISLTRFLEKKEIKKEKS